MTLFASRVLLPCGSLSLARTSISTGWPFVPFAVSALAVGSTFAGGGFGPGFGLGPGPGFGLGLGWGFGCGVASSLSAMTVDSMLLWLPSLFFAVTLEPSLTLSGASVTLPLFGSTTTPGGRLPSACHLPLPSLLTRTVCGWPASSVYLISSVVALLSGVMVTPPLCAGSFATTGGLIPPGWGCGLGPGFGFGPGFGLGPGPGFGLGLGWGFGCGVASSLSAMTVDSMLLWLPSLFFAVTLEPSLTLSGARVTLPVFGSTTTPGGRLPSACHLPFVPLLTCMVCG